ncbi:MAG: ATP-binding protein, partial [Nitrospinales bacterium]
LNEIGAELIFPLIAMNRITGMVFLGKKTSEENFTNEEIDLLNTLLGPAALALENASLYLQQKSRLRKMYRADRLATLGQLAAGAAHEIRNPLMSIRSTMQYLKDDTKEEANKELMDDLIQEVDRIDGIINDLLSFSKSREPQMESVDLKQLLDQVIGLVSTTAKKQKVDLRFLYHQQQTRIKADPGQLKQVFLNILLNALEAIEEKGYIEVTVDLQNISSSGIQNRRDSYFRLVFKDTGTGIPDDHLEHIFDPFYTTKKEGTGLGLSIAYSIVQQHGGEIEMESKVKENEKTEGGKWNHGTKVTVKLPART